MGGIRHAAQSRAAQHGLVRRGVRHAQESVRPGGAKRVLGRRVQGLYDPVGIFHARGARRGGAGPAGRREEDRRARRQRLPVCGHEGGVRAGKGRAPPRQGGRHVRRKVTRPWAPISLASDAARL